MKKLLIILAFGLLLTCNEAGARKLVIVHVNDTHSHLDPERSGFTAGRGGVIERAAYIDSLRKAVGKNHVLLLHAGDWDQGTPYYSVFNGDLEVNLLNALKYDCVTFGNHEFDNDVEDIARRVKMINCPVICANYDFSSFDMGEKVGPYAIVKRGGYKIGIIGMLTDIDYSITRAAAKRIPKIENDAEQINKWASFLREKKKCDLVIVLSHMGYEEDVDVIKGIHDVDIIIGGHSHTYLRDFTYAEDMEGKKVPVIQVGEWGLNLGRIDIN